MRRTTTTNQLVSFLNEFVQVQMTPIANQLESFLLNMFNFKGIELNMFNFKGINFKGIELNMFNFKGIEHVQFQGNQLNSNLFIFKV